MFHRGSSAVGRGTSSLPLMVDTLLGEQAGPVEVEAECEHVDEMNHPGFVGGSIS